MNVPKKDGMKRRQFLVTTLTEALMAAVPLGAFAAASDRPRHLGTLSPFWRNSAVLGPYLEIGGGGLMQIPQYMLAGDFPYRKRPSALEVPFADQLSVVRLLGGYSGDPSGSKDLAYRDSSGTVRYRMELLQPRLQPYLENGYDRLTLVMDNTPWCFPEHPVAPPGGEGQASPPRNDGEWYKFIRAVCVQLVRIAGPQVAANMRFRVGTEDDSADRFTGSQSQFVWFYETTAAAVAAVLPQAEVGPFNISDPTVPGVEKYDHVRALPLAEQCVLYPNVFSKGPRTRFDWIAFSKYFRPGQQTQAEVDPCRAVWNLFGRELPPLTNVSREIHEFGIAPFPPPGGGGFVSAEPGALGAALTCQIMLGLREGGIDRLWHWPGDMFDQFRDAEQRLRLLATGESWLLSVLDRMAGGEYFVFPSPQSRNSMEYALVASANENESVLLLSAYDAKIGQSKAELVQFEVPSALIPKPPLTVQAVYLSKQTSVHDRIRRDLQAAGLLTEQYISHPARLGTVLQMGGPPAAAFVGERWDAYVAQWTQSLTLKPLPSLLGNISQSAGGLTVSLHVAPPLLVALVLRH